MWICFWNFVVEFLWIVFWPCWKSFPEPPVSRSVVLLYPKCSNPGFGLAEPSSSHKTLVRISSCTTIADCLVTWLHLLYFHLIDLELDLVLELAVDLALDMAFYLALHLALNCELTCDLTCVFDRWLFLCVWLVFDGWLDLCALLVSWHVCLTHQKSFKMSTNRKKSNKKNKVFKYYIKTDNASV